MEICTSLFCNWDQKQNSQLVHVLCATGVNVGSFHTSVSSTSVALGEAIVHCLTLSCGSQTSSNIIFHVDSCSTCSQFQIHCYLLFLWISVSLVMVLLPEVSSQLNYSWPYFHRNVYLWFVQWQTYDCTMHNVGNWGKHMFEISSSNDHLYYI